MDESENILDKISEIFGGLPGGLNILEEQIDIDVQMNYFESSRKHKKKNLSSTVLEESDRLFDE